MLLLVSLFFAAFALLLHWGWFRKYDYWKRKGFPYVPGSFPFGTGREMPLMTKFQGHTIQDLYNQLSPNPFGGFYIWNCPHLLLCDPDIIRTVMTKDFQHFRNRGRFKPSKEDPLTQHLFDLDGDLWRALRVKLTPTFTSGRIKHMWPLFEVCAAQLDETVNRISDSGEAVNIKEVTMCYTLDVIMSCAFGLDSNAAENETIRKMSQSLFVPKIRISSLFAVAFNLIFPFLSKIYRIKIIPKTFSEYFLTLMRNTVRHREANNVRRDDFLDLMIQLRNKGTLEDDKHGKSEENKNEDHVPLDLTVGLLAAQCFIFYIAGFETSSSVQTYALYELALHQDVQKRLQKEIDSVIKQNGGQITYQALQEMTYMDQVISEALRKYPTLATLTRECSKSFRLPDHPNLTIDEGTKIIIPVYALHHDPKYFPDPEKFDPDRFSPENKPSIKPYSYLPFGEGPRHCIGMRFGLLQSKVGLTVLLRKYQILPSADTPKAVTFAPSFNVSVTREPIKLLIKPRESTM